MTAEDKNRAKDDPNLATRAPNAPLDKMASGAEELRDHDFPVEIAHARRDAEPATVDTGAPPPEAVQPGGRAGTVAGDVQRVGTVGAILDQVTIEPTNDRDG